MENMLQKFKCMSFWFKRSCFNEQTSLGWIFLSCRMEKILLKTIVLSITTKNAHRELTEYTFRCYFSISWYFDLVKMHCLPKLTLKLHFWTNTYGHRKKWNVNYHRQSITKKWWLASLAELCGILKPFESYKNPYRDVFC